MSGKLFQSGGHLAQAAAFVTKFGAAGYQISRTVIENGVQQVVKFALPRGNAGNGFMHLIRRHLAEYYDGTGQLLTSLNPTSFWPTGTSPAKLLGYLDEAIARMGARPLVPNPNGLFSKIVTLESGITAEIVFKQVTPTEWLIHTFYPISGPGITTIQQIITKQLIP